MITIAIPNKIPSKKNNKIKTKYGIISSKRYREWEETAWIYFKEHRWKKYKVFKMEVEFEVGDRRRRDLSNMNESIQDLLVLCKVIEDDNYFVLPEVSMKVKFSTEGKFNTIIKLFNY